MDKAIKAELKIKILDSSDYDWTRFVMHSRDIDTQQPSHNYDIVIRPVADATISRPLRLFTENFINEEQLIQELTFSKVTSQYLFHSERTIKMLIKL